MVQRPKTRMLFAAPLKVSCCTVLHPSVDWVYAIFADMQDACRHSLWRLGMRRKMMTSRELQRVAPQRLGHRRVRRSARACLSPCLSTQVRCAAESKGNGRH